LPSLISQPIIAMASGDGGRFKPPYTEADDPSQGGIKCYLCGNFKGKSWLSLLQHVRRHGVPDVLILESVLLRKGREEECAQARARYKKKAEAKAASQSSTSAAVPPAGIASAVAAASAPAPPAGNAPAVAAASAAAAHVGNAPAMAEKPFRRKADGTTWRLFWVQTGPRGVPVQPLVMEPVEPEIPCLPPPPPPNGPCITIKPEALEWTRDKLKQDSLKKQWPWRGAPEWPLPDFERYVRLVIMLGHCKSGISNV
jgi:hypothetical protein